MKALGFALVALTLRAEVHQYRPAHFQITIPDGWTEISRHELLSMAKALRQAAPDADAQSYDYGFRPPGAPAHVRLVIQIKHERWSEEFFDQTSKLPRAKGLILHGVTVGSPALAELQPKIGEMRWNPDRQLLWMRTEIQDEKQGPTQILSGAHLTQDGSIQVHCSASSAQYATLAAQFAAVIESVKIDDDFQYVRRSNFSLLFADYGWAVLATVGFASMLGAAFMGRKKPA